MAEIKGQLLGILLVIMVFATVSFSMNAIFTNLGNSVTAEVSELIEDVTN
jgi:hypothetical protein